MSAALDTRLDQLVIASLTFESTGFPFFSEEMVTGALVVAVVVVVVGVVTMETAGGATDVTSCGEGCVLLSVVIGMGRGTEEMGTATTGL